MTPAAAPTQITTLLNVDVRPPVINARFEGKDQRGLRGRGEDAGHTHMNDSECEGGERDAVWDKR